MKRDYEPDKETFVADAYKIQGYEGVAWRVLGWDLEQYHGEYRDECLNCDANGYDERNDETCKVCDGNGYTMKQEEESTERRTGFVVAIMIGDDRHHTLDAGDIVPITREEYCGECGQIGCTHDGYDREEA